MARQWIVRQWTVRQWIVRQCIARRSIPAAALLALAATAQAQSAVESSFESARAVLAQSMAAHGGAERIARISAVRLHLKGDISNGLQGLDPAKPTGHEGDVETRVIMDLAKGRYRTTGEQRSNGGFAFPFNALYKEGSVTFTNPFPPAAIRNPVGDSEEGREQTANTGTRLQPPVLLKLASQRLGTLRDEGSGSFEGRAVRRIAFNTDKNTRVSLAIDAETHRVLGFEQLAPDALTGVDTARWVFRGTQTVDGLVLPQGVTVFRRGLPFLELKLVSVVYDDAAKLADAEFDLDPKFVVRGESPLALAEVRPGLWEVSGANQGFYRMQFAELADRVVVYDAPVSPSTTKAMIEKFREKVPDKPISHVVLSHFHSDHIGGVRTLAELGATIVAAADVQPIVQKVALAQARLFAVADTPLPQLKFATATATLNLGDANRPLRVLEVRDNPHVNRLLVLHDVANRAAMGSDMYSDTTPFNQVFDHFAAWLGQQQDVELMLGAHHPPTAIGTVQDTQAAWRAKQKLAGAEAPKS
jgi:hypothetical protein